MSLVSFVVPSFNCGVWLPHAVASCLEQTYKDIEVVVVNDGSTDFNTQDYLSRFKDDRLRVINLEKNTGISNARNVGNRAAKGEVIFVQDSDDISTPNRVEISLAKMRRSNADYIYGATTVMDAIGRPMQIIMPDVLSKERSLTPPYRNHIVHSTVCYKREYAERFPYRDEMSAVGLDDWAMQLEGLIAGMKFDFVPQRLACNRLRSNQITATRREIDVINAKHKFLDELKVLA